MRNRKDDVVDLSIFFALVGGIVITYILSLASPAFAGQNVLSWTDNASNEQNFNIERKTEACAGGAAFVPPLSRTKELVEIAGLEPATSALRTPRSPN